MERPWWPYVLGASLGAVLLAAVLSCGAEEPFREVEDFRPEATPAEIAEWTGQYERRALPWKEFPDPPGDGEITTARYWVSRTIYEMEIRRRGDRLTLGISGVDTQTFGGGWISFGEGRVTGEPGSFRGAVATISWSCLGVRYRHASDGVARLTFTPDGREFAAVYVAHEAPDLWLKSYGRIAEGPKPLHGEIRGQIPFTRALTRFPAGPHAVPVRVEDLRGIPLRAAEVQVKGRPRTRVETDDDGRASVTFGPEDGPWAVALCVGAAGHLVAEHVLFPDDLGSAGSPVVVRLSRVPLADHPSYAWPPVAPDQDPDDVSACGTCHSWQYDEWVGSRHARAADHAHVEYERSLMRRGDPGAPDDCRGCHQPAHATSAPGGGWRGRGPSAGVHCDLCHKVARILDVRASGVFGALEVVRPDPASRDRPGGIHHVFGPTGDVTFSFMGASHAPWMSSSFFCAGCHQGGGRTDLGLPKIDTFEEWRAWAATRADERFRSCQDCHMPGASTRTVEGRVVDQLAWDATHRRPAAVHSHRFDGTSAAFLGNGLDLRVSKRFDEAAREWVVDVAVKNVVGGHKIPTGTWTKHVAVGVWARAGGRWLRRSGGDVARLLPSEGPDEPLAAGDWRNPAGLVLRVRPKDARYGRLSAKFWGAWKPEDLVDERLAPDEERHAVCRFDGAGPDETPEVEVQVVHRRGEIGEGPATAPWDPHLYDPPPQTLWTRIVR